MSGWGWVTHFGLDALDVLDFWMSGLRTLTCTKCIFSESHFHSPSSHILHKVMSSPPIVLVIDWKQQAIKLETRNHQLKQLTAVYRQINENLCHEIEELKAEIEAMKSENVEELKAEIEELKAEFKLKSKRRKTNRRMSPPLKTRRRVYNQWVQ